jgi:hypothetical protein
MTRLTCLLCCLFLVQSVVPSACAIGVIPVGQPVVKLPTSNFNDAQLRPLKVDDDWFLKKMLPQQQHKRLKLAPDLQGLADRGVSRPERGTG